MSHHGCVGKFMQNLHALKCNNCLDYNECYEKAKKTKNKLSHKNTILTGLSVALSGLKEQSGWDAETADLQFIINHIREKAEQ